MIINDAIAKEKQLKKWSRKKKDDLINKSMPKLLSPNEQFRVD